MRRLPLSRPIAMLGALALTIPLAASAAAEPAAPLTAPTTISVPGLSATVAADFPQVVSYQVGTSQLGGRTDTVRQVLVDGNARAVQSVASTRSSDTKVTYQVTLDAGASFEAEILVDTVASHADGTQNVTRPTLTFRITKLIGGHTIEIPGQSLVSVSAKDAGAAFAAATTGTARGAKADDPNAGVQDTFGQITDSTSLDQEARNSAYLFLNTSQVAVGLETNATPDVVHGANANSNGRWSRQVVAGADGTPTLTARAGEWTYRSAAATDAIGDEQRPYATLVFAGDANSSGNVDWQDAAVAYADVAEPVRGAAENAKHVITHIPFNFASQATHPFLRTADDVKRIGLATDNLGQRVMLKGYESEGHDSAHPDYASNVNNRAGGAQDLKTLFDATSDVNAIYGIHVNTTEAYPDAQSFSTLDFTGLPGWDWLGKSYYIDQRHDLGKGKVTSRFQALRDEFPLASYPSFRWIYIDVYYGSGWTSDRLGQELNKQGWEVGSEWSDKFERHSVWSHWSNDENYGGASLKGLNSEVIRFIDNANKDTWNPDVALGYPQVVEFEGWTGHQDQRAFYANVWGNNLPAKFIQASRLMRHETEAVGAATKHIWTTSNGTVASGTTAVTNQTAGDSVAGQIRTDMAASREISYDGATVLRGNSYLLPWTDNGTKDGAPRLYYYNPDGGESTWQLTRAFAGQTSLALYRLTDQGKRKISDLPVSGGSVTIPASVYDDVAAGDRASTAFVLYPSTTPAVAAAPQWGAGTVFTDPGFNAGDLKAYTTTGNVTATRDSQNDPIAQIDNAEGSLAQSFTLDKGTYEGSAWVEIGNGTAQREVTVSATGKGVGAAGSQTGQDTSTATAEQPVTVAFEDFENVPQGWGPFVKGNAGRSTDPRTVLAPLNAPYTQQGWRTPNGRVKATDDVIGGHWSLKSHSENGGLVYRTVPQTVDFKVGHRYRVSFDYENAVAGPYQWVTAYDSLGARGVRSTTLNTTDMPVATSPTHFTEEFVAGGCGTYWVGLHNTQGGVDAADFTMDNFRVEDLGTSDAVPACAAASLRVLGVAQAGATATVVTTVTNSEAVAITDVTSALTVPEGWTATPRGSATAASVAAGDTFTVTWNVTVPDSAGGKPFPLAHKATYKVDGAARTATGTTTVAVLGGVATNGVTYLSDLPINPAYNKNGWGPVERDLGNGEQEQGDGPAMSIDGTEYAKGLGAHAHSDVGFDLNGKCHTFAAVVGVDDAQTSLGSVTFEVQGTRDGSTWESVVPRTEVLRATSAGKAITGNVVGMRTIRLIAGDGGDGNGNDHADWGNARVACGTATIDQADPDTPAPGAELTPYTGALQVIEAPASYTANPAANMLDKNPETFYDKDWVNLQPHPSTVVLGLYQGTDVTAVSPTKVSGLSITGRSGQANGRVENYKVYVGQDAANVSTLVAEGRLANSSAEQRIVFSRPVDAKLIKLEVTSSYKTNASQPDGLLAIAEINALTGEITSANPAQPEQPATPPTPEADPAGITSNTNADGVVGQNYLDVVTAADSAKATGSASTVINSTFARNYVAADQKHDSFFQRVPVRFKVGADGTKVTFKVAAAAGDTPVRVDDLRLVKIDKTNTNDLLDVDCTANPTPEQCGSATANSRVGLSTPSKAAVPPVTPTPQPTEEPQPPTPEGSKPAYVASVEAAGESKGHVLVGDWDGDGTLTYAVRVGTRVVFYNENRTDAPVYASISIGRRTDEVLVGDWDNDGKDTLALRRGTTVLTQNHLTSTATTKVTVDGITSQSKLMVKQEQGKADVIVVVK
ncbi:endo-alpha-N-acetylgalactosaminidase family protein [Actinomyces trachealis]|uniref:endo-alpha-N-acetylgalactosaminidase family protein n=1 Tax=Actinomyces trachealis TaxID=2763540 RepID=UPI0018C583EA|nr:endo-alpha-N-acetylgalactosaminidase family protein [Actinomyces trachealis]